MLPVLQQQLVGCPGPWAGPRLLLSGANRGLRQPAQAGPPWAPDPKALPGWPGRQQPGALERKTGRPGAGVPAAAVTPLGCNHALRLALGAGCPLSPILCPAGTPAALHPASAAPPPHPRPLQQAPRDPEHGGATEATLSFLVAT